MPDSEGSLLDFDLSDLTADPDEGTAFPESTGDASILDFDLDEADDGDEPVTLVASSSADLDFEDVFAESGNTPNLEGSSLDFDIEQLPGSTDAWTEVATDAASAVASDDLSPDLDFSLGDGGSDLDTSVDALTSAAEGLGLDLDIDESTVPPAPVVW